MEAGFFGILIIAFMILTPLTILKAKKDANKANKNDFEKGNE